MKGCLTRFDHTLISLCAEQWYIVQEGDATMIIIDIKPGP
jgi:hypothetical protein